jgi:hypothetical protein
MKWLQHKQLPDACEFGIMTKSILLRPKHSKAGPWQEACQVLIYDKMSKLAAAAVALAP